MAGLFLKTSGLAALAAGLALAASPASAQDQGRGRWGGGAEASSQRGGSDGRSAERETGRADRQSAPQDQQRAERRPAWRGQADAGGNDAAREAWRAQRAEQAPVARQAEPRSRDWQRNRDYTDAQRNRSYRDGSRDRDWQDARRNDGNRWQGDGNWRGDRRGYAQNTRGWDRDWRRDNRYNWSGYRNANRNVYRIGRYYAPYRDYGYRRLGIGFGLESVFFGSRYWINDPWQYRLPAVYGPYRWVRYFDDVLLVDTYSGQVVDVIYDFFW